MPIVSVSIYELYVVEVHVLDSIFPQSHVVASVSCVPMSARLNRNLFCQ